ncbi:probable N-acetyltransferase 5 [Melanopsichium pennsylvanicum]|uniref:Probable N-acetyltransferase 5 n=2 Tax=Melanopsichium pennsylvanicum TaxID=63383 RepID=A0AAJ4XQN8_9BASI|nr:probable N-acetyltransferase 5 [Melanopsichium pennsylvanicum 4]SNX86156.1 probable N-acetyltransferase 5 [Melanopsichium pennsylvanicum]
MSHLRPFRATDLFKFNNVNLDHWTETYSLSFYLSYLAQWPDLSFIQTAPASGRTMGYVIGKAEGNNPNPSSSSSLTSSLKLKYAPNQLPSLHGHVTAITIAPEYRRLGLANGLMALLEDVSDRVYRAYFVDLFVRPSNTTAVTMYEKLGYQVYRNVKGYYYGGGAKGNDEDGFDMRKALPRDTNQITVRSNGRNFIVHPQDTIFEPAYRP